MARLPSPRAVLWWAALPLMACQAEVATGLEEHQANQLVVTLEEAGIGAEKSRSSSGVEGDSFEVRVPVNSTSEALRVLSAAELPRQSEPGLNEVFGEASLVPTRTEERARFAAALAGELARSIEAIEGVLDARVHVALDTGHDLSLDQAPPRPKASVLIKHGPSAPTPDADQIRSLVSGAVHQMLPEDVAVMIVRATEASPRQSPLVHVGPFAVTKGTAPILRGALLATLLLHLLLAASLIFVLRRKRMSMAPRSA